jgi:tetratricopeptide (TPR) repeat protein
MPTNFNFTDPTYLRTIYDGFLSGTLHKDNASSLPVGLVGIYEEALPPANHVKERQKFLDFFAAWALLKKEGSVQFVAQLLGWPEEQVLDYIARYSKWFNAPTSGKYVLYHERLRSFVLQKISHVQFTSSNETIIKLGQEALERRSGDEWEHYALEHLSTHLLIRAMETGSVEILKALAYNTAHWNRQIEISKGFEWSKRMLNDMMLWASKYDEDEVIECALNKVDLYHLEQNDAPRIVELVAQNDIETALHRIEAFGGNDKKGLQRKFILYMLCLMELTLLDSKDKPFRKEAIEKLLKHLDNNLPVDHSVLNWNDFFSSYLVFQMACEWLELGLDYLIVFTRTADFDVEWISEKGPYSDVQFEIFNKCARVISKESSKVTMLLAISRKLLEQFKIEESKDTINYSIQCARQISISYFISKALIGIYEELIMLDEVLYASEILQEAVLSIEGNENIYMKSFLFSEISTKYFKLGNYQVATEILDKAFSCVQFMDDAIGKSKSLKVLSVAIAKQGKIDKAIEIAEEICTESERSRAYLEIALELYERENLIEAQFLLKMALEDANNSSSVFFEPPPISEIAIALAKRGRFDESIQYASQIIHDYWRSNTLKDISMELFKNNMKEEARSLLLEALLCAKDSNTDVNILPEIFAELVKQGNITVAFNNILEITDDKQYVSVIYSMIKAIAENDNVYESTYRMFDILEYRPYFKISNWKDIYLNSIINKYIINEEIEDSINLARKIQDIDLRIRTILKISNKLIKQKKAIRTSCLLAEASEEIRLLNNDMQKITLFSDFVSHTAHLGFVDEATQLFREINSFLGSVGQNPKCCLISKISTGMFLLGRKDEAEQLMNESLEGARGINDNIAKIDAFIKISSELLVQSKVADIELIMQETVDCATAIEDEFWKYDALQNVAVQLSRLGKYESSRRIIKFIRDPYFKGNALLKISIDFRKSGYAKRAAFYIKSSLKYLDDINIGFLKCKLLKNIAIEFANQGEYGLSEKTGMLIEIIDERQECWTVIGENTINKLGLDHALLIVGNYQFDEVQQYYLKGLADSVINQDLNREILLKTIFIFRHDLKSMEKLLRHHAVHELFFQDTPTKQIERFNRTLNIQWAIDIKNSVNVN